MTVGSGQELTLTLEVTSPPQVIAGLPLDLTATLKGNAKFILHGPFLITCSDHGGIRVKDQSGNPVRFSVGGPCPIEERDPFDSEYKTDYDGIAIASDIIFLPPGK